jgi:hypothetical protein
MTAIYGLYEDPASAQRAFTSLRRAGVDTADITVISAEPFEAFEFSERDKSLVLFRLAGIGGVIGCLAGYLLTTGTERAWPLVTGGMPITPWWPNLIVIFELTMLGAILTTVVSLLVTGRLPSRKQSLYDPAISDGKILVGVPLAAGRAEEDVRRAFDAGAPVAVKTADFAR